MLARLPLGAVIALAFLSPCASAGQPPLGLQDLLSIGLGAAPPGLQWGATRRQIRQRYADLIEHPAFIGFRLEGTVSAAGCTFSVYLSGGRKSDQLERIWIEYHTGTLAVCRTQLESALAALYGPPATATAPATQFSGAATLSAWRTATTCVNMRWEEQGVDHGVSPLNVTLADLRAACG